MCDVNINTSNRILTSCLVIFYKPGLHQHCVLLALPPPVTLAAHENLPFPWSQIASAEARTLYLTVHGGCNYVTRSYLCQDWLDQTRSETNKLWNVKLINWIYTIVIPSTKTVKAKLQSAIQASKSWNFIFQFTYVI